LACHGGLKKNVVRRRNLVTDCNFLKKRRSEGGKGAQLGSSVGAASQEVLSKKIITCRGPWAKKRKRGRHSGKNGVGRDAAARSCGEAKKVR